MKEKSLILICIILISFFTSPNLLSAKDKKIKKLNTEKIYKHLELKNYFLKTEPKKIPVICLKTENSAMSKFPATMLGAGIGLVGGGAIGALIGTAIPSGGSSELFPPEVAGAVIGGFSGLIIGGVIGYVLGK